MARSLNGSTDYLSNGAAPLSNYLGLPLTMAAWFYPADTTTDKVIASVGAMSAGAWTGLYLYANSSAKVSVVSTTSNSFAGSASTSTSYSANTWQHACGVFTSDLSRAVYLNGGGKGTDTTSDTPSGFDGMRIGSGLTGSPPTAPFNGRLAEVAMWLATLTDAEVAALATGVSPRKVRPASLVAYWPLFGIQSPEPDMAAGTYGMTLHGTGQANHAPVSLFTPNRRTPCDVAVVAPTAPVPRPLVVGQAVAGAVSY